MLNVYEDEASKIGLKINFAKTKIMIVSNSPPPSHLIVRDKRIEIVDDFLYLGSKINNKGDTNQEVTRRRALASVILNKLNKPLWKWHNISDSTKIRIFKASVQSILLYGAETWPLSDTLAKRLTGFDNRAQRRVLDVRWQARMTNEQVRSRSHQPPLQRVLAQRRLRWFGHVLRMPEEHPTHVALRFAPGLDGWRRPRGRPRTRWRDVVDDDLRDIDVRDDAVQQLAQDRSAWRNLVSVVASTPHRHEV